MKRKKSEYSIQAVDNALDVLEQFTGEKSELGITEISRNLGLHKNNIFRLLATLESRDYIQQNRNNDHYRLGIKVLELGKAFINHTGLNKIAPPFMRELAKEVNENVYLGILMGKQVFYIQHVESTQRLTVRSRIGTRLSPLCTGVGKVILAYYSHEDREQIINSNKFVIHTPKTIKDKDSFETELEEIKGQGYAIDDEEMDIGITCVSGPIFDYGNRIIAGLSLSGPTSRLTPEAMEELYIPKVEEYCKKISRAIGHIA